MDLLQVLVLRSGLRYPVPTTADGGALQKLLQHLRQCGLVYHRLIFSRCRWRAADRSRALHSLSRMERQRANVPFPHIGHALVAYIGRRFLDALQVDFRIRPITTELGRSSLRCQHTRRCGARWRAAGGRNDRDE